MEGPIVTIANGKLKGKINKNIRGGDYCSFQSIPYAKPPIGHLRFKAPEPADPWTGILDATKDGTESFSRHYVLKTLIGGEDCLILNVFTRNIPQSKDLLLKPVMFWIYGGAFTSGSSSSEIYGPEFLLTEDIVLVTINYRTGVLGFLSLEDPTLDVPGNAGLKDMVLALKRVQENIKQFGGDPNNVTIFGESAGAASVHYLILSPMTKGLFHKAILQSGCALNVWASGRKCATDLAQVLSLETTDERKILVALQNLPVAELFQAAEKLPDLFLANFTRPFGPVIERQLKNAFLSHHPLDVIRSGQYNHVPIMIGYTTREGMLLEIKQRPEPFKPLTNFELAVPNFLKIQQGSDLSKMIAKQIKEFYYGNEEPSVKNKDIFYLLETDNFFVRDFLRTVKYHVETSSAPVYLYRMSIETSLNIFKNIYEITEPGVCHADDLGYLFKNILTPEIEPGTDEEIAVKRFVKLWTNFARFGNPIPKRDALLLDVEWKPVTKHCLNFLDIGKNLTTGVYPEGNRMEFWDKILNVNPVCKL